MPPKHSLKKVKMNIEFRENKKIEIRGRYIPKDDSVEFAFVDLDTKEAPINLEDEHCEEMAKMFYALYTTFRDIQGNEEDAVHEFDMNEYRAKHNKLP